ncbi:MAG: hypothetical protein ABW252_07245 [Polyangiales bacterium]
MTTMSLRRSESIFRLLIGFSLAVGFVGFATHSRAEHSAGDLVVTTECGATHDAL